MDLIGLWEQLLQVWLSALSVLVLLIILFLIRVRKKLKEIEQDIYEEIEEENKENLIQQEKEEILVIKESDLQKTINPTLSYQMAKQDLSKNPALDALEK